jgi:hypothetical protein
VTSDSPSTESSVLHMLSLLAKGTANKFSPIVFLLHRAQDHRATQRRFPLHRQEISQRYRLTVEDIRNYLDLISVY